MTKEMFFIHLSNLYKHGIRYSHILYLEYELMYNQIVQGLEDNF